MIVLGPGARRRGRVAGGRVSRARRWRVAGGRVSLARRARRGEADRAARARASAPPRIYRAPARGVISRIWGAGPTGCRRRGRIRGLAHARPLAVDQARRSRAQFVLRYHPRGEYPRVTAGPDRGAQVARAIRSAISPSGRVSKEMAGPDRGWGVLGAIGRTRRDRRLGARGDATRPAPSAGLQRPGRRHGTRPAPSAAPTMPGESGAARTSRPGGRRRRGRGGVRLRSWRGPGCGPAS